MLKRRLSNHTDAVPPLKPQTVAAGGSRDHKRPHRGRRGARDHPGESGQGVRSQLQLPQTNAELQRRSQRTRGEKTLLKTQKQPLKKGEGQTLELFSGKRRKMIISSAEATKKTEILINVWKPSNVNKPTFSRHGDH